MRRISIKVSNFSPSVPLFFPVRPVSFHPTFQAIADSSKILTNIGLIYATLGEHEAAVEQFIAATRLDNYLAVASVPSSSPSPALLRIFSPSTIFSYFQCGVSNFLLGRYDLSSKDFEGALLYLRGNQSMCVARIVYHHFMHS